MHYNIGKKIEVNPFENVTGITLAEFSKGKLLLQAFLDNSSESVETKKISNCWRIVYNIDKLDFTTILVWCAPNSGKFQFKGNWIHFILEDSIMSCW